MSGSNSYMEPEFSNPKEYESCENLEIVAHIASPVAKEIEKLVIGDNLIIKALTNSGPVQVLSIKNNLIGNVLSKDVERLLSCLNGGTDYFGIVLNIDGGACLIKIKAGR